MSTIIFLNGCGSAGKSSIAKSIQHLSNEAWLHFSLDMFVDMMPNKYMPFNEKASEGFEFIPSQNEHGQVITIKQGAYGQEVFACMPPSAALLADAGHNLIIDEVLLGDETFKNYARALQKHRIYFIGVFCSLEVMQEREFLRGDRVVGLSNGQINEVHNGLRDYTLKVDTTHNSPFKIAKEILQFIDKHPHPKALTLSCSL